MSDDFSSIFARLRAILQKHAGALRVKTDAADCYCLEAAAGPAAIRAWGGKVKKPMIPVAWVEIGKAYVSFHHMAFYGNAKLLDGMSEDLLKRMQGKTCFNFTHPDEALFKELEQLTARGFAGFKKAGFVSA